MSSNILFIPPYSQQSEWKKMDDLPSEIRSVLDKYCLCSTEWQDKDLGVIKCSTNEGCGDQDCIFWTVTYVNIETMKFIQDIKINKFGEPKPDTSGTVLKFSDDNKSYKILRLPRDRKDGDLHPSELTQVIFCSCGTLEEIAKSKAKHRSVGAPVDDPPK